MRETFRVFRVSAVSGLLARTRPLGQQVRSIRFSGSRVRIASNRLPRALSFHLFFHDERERKRERKKERNKIFTRLQTRLSRSIHEEEKEGRNETRRTKECEVVGCSIEAIILEDDWFSDCVWKCLNTRENGGLRERGWKLINDRKLFYLGKNKKK